MSAAEDQERQASRALALVRLFHGRPAEWCDFEPRQAADVPQPFRRLLDHHSHMTVAMEATYGTPLGLRVLRVHEGNADPGASDAYAREILLLAPGGAVVQYGIVRIDLQQVGPGCAAAIRSPTGTCASSCCARRMRPSLTGGVRRRRTSMT